MSIKLPPEIKGSFRYDALCFIDPKLLNINYVLLSFLELIKHEGMTSTCQQINPDILKERLPENMLGKKTHEIEWWFRNNLVNITYRGKSEELYSSLKPLHLQSIILRDKKKARDYGAGNQLYSFIHSNDEVINSLKKFLNQGWDETNKSVNSNNLDVIGILSLIKFNSDNPTSPKGINFKDYFSIMPQLARTFCEDLKNILEYQHVLPRHIMVEYIKILAFFHLGLFYTNLVYNLPKKIAKKDSDLFELRKIFVDLTDGQSTYLSDLAIEESQKLYGSVYDFIRSAIKLNLSIRSSGLNLTSPNVINKINLGIENDILNGIANLTIDQIIQFHDGNPLPEDLEAFRQNNEISALDKYAEIVLSARLKFHQKYQVQLLDSLFQKNTPHGLLIQNRGRGAKRKFNLGIKLLEVLVQLRLLNRDGEKIYTAPVAIDDFVAWIEDRYGIVINAIRNNKQIEDAESIKAFNQNVDALKEKLRQIGFYNILSDARILQRIRPRYIIEKGVTK